MKVLHVEVEVLLPVQLQHLLHRLHRHSLRARAAFAVVPQTAIAVFVQPFSPTSHGTVCHAHNLGSFPPLQLPGRRLQNHFLCLHHPLHFGGWDLLFADFHSSQLSPAISKRTFHLLIEADISHATDNLYWMDTSPAAHRRIMACQRSKYHLRLFVLSAFLAFAAAF